MEEDKSLKGIGGWLILPLIGLFLTPIRILFVLYRDFSPIFQDGVWEKITNPSSGLYHPLFVPFLIYELVGNVFFIIFVMVLLLYFFNQNKKLPKLMVLFIILNFIFVLVDGIIILYIPIAIKIPSGDQSIETIRAFLVMIALVPYFLKSKRVKQTFIN